MRTLFAASALVLFSTVVLSACSSAPDASSEDTASTSEALAIRGVDTAPPTKGTRPPPPLPPPDAGTPDPGPHHPLGGIVRGGKADVLAQGDVCYPKTRFDLRRKTRSCEDLPGAYVQGGVTFVPGSGGKYRVGRLLAGTAAPAVLQARACIYTWEPDSCAAPDSSKLLLESTEKVAERPSTCLTNPASCGITVTPPATHPPHSIPNGPGRCDVCGFGTNRTLWVVLPPTWSNFSYQLQGEQTNHYVFMSEAPVETSAEEPVVVEVELPYEVVDQDVTIYPSGP